MERVLRELLEDGRFKDVPEGNARRMKAIRATGNKSTELRLRALLVRAGVRGWKLRPEGLPGKPDFLFPEARVIVFVDGCFWHGCPRCGNVPSVNRPYWAAKISGNMARDKERTRALRRQGYRVLRLWEHELRERPERCVERIRVLL
jgi:DNA mismatch endonuclease (patch repair protein)